MIINNSNYSNPNFNAKLKINRNFMNAERALRLEQQFAEKTKNIKDYEVFIGNKLSGDRAGYEFDIYDERLGKQMYGVLKENAVEIFEKLKDSEIIQACKKLVQLVRKENLQEEYLLKKCDEISNKLDLDAYDGIRVIMDDMETKSCNERIRAMKNRPIFEAFDEVM